MKNNLESHIEKNKNILIYVDGKLMSRDEAKVSVYDSGFMMGDGVWEGIRLYNNKWLFLDEHIHRLYEGAKAIDLDINLTKDQLKNALFDTQKINKMIDRAHARVMITRGIKSKPFQRPSYSLDGPTIVIIMEHSEDNIKREPITLATVSQIRGNPMVQDPKLNSHSKLNCILACIQAEKAGADEALMLDPLGFVSTTNSCNFFIVKGSEVWTSTGDYCMNGITRKKIIEICKLNQISIYEKNFSLVDVYSADEAFITGTLGSLVSVKSIDGRLIENKNNYSMTEKLLKLYEELTQSD
ncbi:aminotransferase class IV [Gammaproteobacteria bacterium]|jgi:branched-chain amino acid aminotransferase|nr:aminotransferase class IV [Flavobacteriales bacterium]MBT7524705.1 aminotransferase class IV [Candidatus Neomarinimicrobiota bacterium]MDA9578081.1 aminotransferase class IV [Gammaproteobacteria bacterium]MDA9621407.1 aminotransferase class IV [Gammaproteobacteria bacterium]MDB2482152.1 aminotransferase class IV [Gammaproteobacteria bacterium]|tara:strand:- start:1271 stop:2164 length:894 start_codon:yes stop_codon:yes gene_type:complete